MYPKFKALLFPLILLISGCLLFISPPEIKEIEDVSAAAGKNITVIIEASDPGGRDITLTYRIDGGGWAEIQGLTLELTFDDPGSYLVTVSASNGLRQSDTAFTVKVT